MTKILGISAFYHDSAATLVENGKLLECIQEERRTYTPTLECTILKGDKCFH